MANRPMLQLDYATCKAMLANTVIQSASKTMSRLSKQQYDRLLRVWKQELAVAVDLLLETTAKETV